MEFPSSVIHGQTMEALLHIDPVLVVCATSDLLTIHNNLLACVSFRKNIGYKWYSSDAGWECGYFFLHESSLLVKILPAYLVESWFLETDIGTCILCVCNNMSNGCFYLVGGDNVPGWASASNAAITQLSRLVVSNSINIQKSTSICWFLS